MPDGDGWAQASSCEAIVLVKPEFEVGRERVEKEVVRDPEAHADAIAGVMAQASLGWQASGLVGSPITGPAGNHGTCWLSSADQHSEHDHQGRDHRNSGLEKGLSIECSTVAVTGADRTTVDG